MTKKKGKIIDAGLAECIRHINPKMKIGQHFKFGERYAYEKRDNLGIYYYVEEGNLADEMDAFTFKTYFRIIDNSVKKGQ